MQILETGNILGHNVILYDNKYLHSLSNFWKIKILFGKEKTLAFLNTYNNKITEINLDILFKSCNITFYISQDNMVLLNNNSELSVSQFGILNTISLFDALKLYNLDEIEETLEKNYYNKNDKKF